ncbi:helix-turn-helix transcriptional regulator [Methylobacterium sp. 22177]|uniref:helix-turn-helix transcriptional regulator n=1 Tax=Methylobacterium sp. 22177 TaxID=3453885 RepID=UPI003F842F2E
MQQYQDQAQRFLTPLELSSRWSGTIGVTTLANWRSRGRGPKYAKIGGRVLYPVAQVVAWEEHHMASGTGQYRPAPALTSPAKRIACEGKVLAISTKSAKEP